jgi:mutator protein MutT
VGNVNYRQLCSRPLTDVLTVADAQGRIGMPESPPMHEIVTAALVREGRVLLVHRSPNKHVYPNVWDLPGGHIDAGETELAALAREMHEELGVQIATGSAIHLCRLEIGRAEESVRFSAWIVGEWEGTPTNAAPDEHDEIRWFGPEELPPLAHEPVGTALREAMRGART